MQMSLSEAKDPIHCAIALLVNLSTFSEAREILQG